ncbi:MAG: aromatic acid decarboxylase, partial [Gammaproteobacteria bacterium]
VDFLVARLLDHLEIPQELMPRWGQDKVEVRRKS